MRGIGCIVMLACACGRIGFDPSSDGPTSSGDGTGDGSSFADTCLSHPTAVFCDGFELGLAAWQSMSGTPTRTVDLVHGGVGALFTTIAMQPQVASVSVQFAPVTGPAFHMRGWFFVPSQTVFGNITLMAGGFGGQSLGVFVAADNLSFHFDTPAAVELTGPPMPRDRWFCLDFSLVLSDAAGVLDMRVDGQTVLSQTGLDTLPTGGIEFVSAGIDFSGAQQTGPATVYVDDIVVDTAPIGCAP